MWRLAVVVVFLFPPSLLSTSALLGVVCVSRAVCLGCDVGPVGWCGLCEKFHVRLTFSSKFQLYIQLLDIIPSFACNALKR